MERPADRADEEADLMSPISFHDWEVRSQK